MQRGLFANLESQENLDETKVSILLQSLLLEKIKLIAEKEDRKPQQEIERALRTYIQEYEKEKGSI